MLCHCLHMMVVPTSCDGAWSTYEVPAPTAADNRAYLPLSHRHNVITKDQLQALRWQLFTASREVEALLNLPMRVFEVPLFSLPPEWSLSLERPSDHVRHVFRPWPARGLTECYSYRMALSAGLFQVSSLTSTGTLLGRCCDSQLMEEKPQLREVE